MLPENSTDFQINLILAAFDKNGDGRLNFEDARFSFFSGAGQRGEEN